MKYTTDSHFFDNQFFMPLMLPGPIIGENSGCCIFKYLNKKYLFLQNYGLININIIYKINYFSIQEICLSILK